MLCCFLAVWPIAPFAPFIFVMLNVAVVLIVNAKVRPLIMSRYRNWPRLHRYGRDAAKAHQITFRGDGGSPARAAHTRYQICEPRRQSQASRERDILVY